jgi:lipopolysaccharide/colanic/teichoic acid biosynthesis glycosyltransferase
MAISHSADGAFDNTVFSGDVSARPSKLCTVEPSAQFPKWEATIWLPMYSLHWLWQIASGDHGLKRAFDIIVSLVLLIALSPVLVGIALAIRRSSGRPVFFRQMRAGLNGRPFELVKFRTMSNPADPTNPLPDENRSEPFGQFLRSTSLDELPELWNVLKGDMSIVGPRPLLVEYIPRYSAMQARRHEVRPGITGWAQVNGRTSISWKEKFALDVWYVDQKSVWLDLRIIGMTVFKVLSRKDITERGTIGRFLGNEDDQ